MATVIKADEQDPKLVRRLATLNVADHLGEAELVLKASREEARRMLRETRVRAAAMREKEAERGYEAGFRRGYEAGTKAGYEEAFETARKEFAEDQGRLIEAMNTMIADFEERKRDLFISAVGDVRKFAMKVAEKVTKQVGVVHQDSAAANLEAALRLVESKTDLVICLHPADRATIERFVESFTRRAEQARNISIEVDESMAPGGCRLRAPEAEIDATLDTQIEQIALLMTPGSEGSV